MPDKFRKFAAAATIHGLHHASKKSHLSKDGRYVWPMVICLAMIFCLWQSYLSVKEYFSYNVTTSVYYKPNEQLTYPAITIWNENSLRRTVIGRNQTRMLIAMLNGGDSNGIAKLYYQINKTCYYQPPSHDRIDDILSSLDIAALSSASPDMITKILDFATINKKMNFFKCYWRNFETDCESIILTTMLENGQGFSFNLDTNVVQNFIGNESGLGSLNKMYPAETQTKYFLTTGIENGLKFILNVNQDDYCAYTKSIWYGAGFQLKFHDPKTLPSDLFGSSISLNPGNHYNVAIKPIQHFRNTEHLGRCISSYPMYMFPESDGYMKELCHIQCENEIVWQRCGCMSTWLRQAGIAFARHHNLDEQTVSLSCFGGNRTCLLEIATIAANQGIENICPQCKQPCIESEYSYEMTIAQFPPKHLIRFYSKQLNVTDGDSISKNFLMVNIYFESSLTQLVIENQLFTVRDLFIYIGNSISLFLGMSFMSFAEILHFLSELTHFVIMKSKVIAHKRFRKRTRVQTIKIRQKCVLNKRKK